MEAVPGVRLVNDDTDSFPKPSRSSGRPNATSSGSTLSGSSPLPTSKGKLLEAARAGLGGVEVVDQTNLSRGAPPRFDNAALLLLDQIGKLKDGKITLTDTKVSLSGMARELGGREAITAALKNLPDGYSVAANEIKAPPYVFQAYKDPVAVTLTLTGYVPENNVHSALVAAAARKFFSEKVVDNLKASVGAPSGFANAVVPALSALSRLSTGTLVVSDREVKLSGDALYDAAADQIRAGLGKDFPQGWQFKADISVKPRGGAGGCHGVPAIVRGSARPREESGSNPAEPTSIADSVGLLDRLVETALRCPNAKIEIAGHTDGDGEENANRTLSEKRAQAVTDYLVKAGLPANRFTPVGYGSHPAGRRQRYRRRQGAEPPYRFRGEVTHGLSRDIPSGAGCWRRFCSASAWAGLPSCTAARASRRSWRDGFRCSPSRWSRLRLRASCRAVSASGSTLAW